MGNYYELQGNKIRGVSSRHTQSLEQKMQTRLDDAEENADASPVYCYICGRSTHEAYIRMMDGRFVCNFHDTA